MADFIPNNKDWWTDSFEITSENYEWWEYFIVNKIRKRNWEIAHSWARPFKTEAEAKKYMNELITKSVKREDKYNLINHTWSAYWVAETSIDGKLQYYVTSRYIIDWYIVEDLYDCIITYSREEAQKKIDELS